MMHKIAIVDFGGQYTHLIARRIRNLGVYSEIVQPEKFHSESEYKGIIFSGGPQSVNGEDAYKIDIDIRQNTIPILGICYGHQILASLLGGKIESGENKEYGLTEIKCKPGSALFSGLDQEQTVWMSHGDHVVCLPKNVNITASTSSIGVASFQSEDNLYFGTQFHPEVTHTENGIKMLDNFLDQCAVKRDWTAHNFKDQLISEIQEQGAGKKLVLLLSGGVDSLVALELCIQAVGTDNVHSIHVDTGFMRLNESTEIMVHFAELGYSNIKILEAEDLYLKELQGITDPETKRLIIGKLFVDLANKELQELERDADVMLVQGTIYPDTIESGSTEKAAKIKTHHNRVDEIEKLIRLGKVIEPIKDLYKDEVRKLGEELSLPVNLVHRHPFPGPGLAIRVICSNTAIADETYLTDQTRLENILSNYGLEGRILPIKSVGVQGDFRTYHHPAVVWFKDLSNFNWKLLKAASTQAVNELKTVNRMLFSLDENQVQLQELYLVKPVLDKLREVDQVLRARTDGLSKIWQMPVVALPLFENDDQIFIMRPVCSTDAMTASVYEMDLDLMQALNEEVKNISGAGAVFYDLTTKPPGTIEWE